MLADLSDHIADYQRAMSGKLEQFLEENRQLKLRNFALVQELREARQNRAAGRQQLVLAK